MSRPRSRFKGAILCVATSACGDLRPTEGADPTCIGWQDGVEPLFRTRCASCHAGDSPRGSYDVSTYAGVLGGGTDDIPNARGGDPSSRLIVVLATHPEHAALGAEPHVRRWVVDGQLAYACSDVHPGGFLNPDDASFHGRLIAELGYDLKRCAACHGLDFNGGRALSSCTTCHAEGPTACDTCHRDLFANGSHRIHIVGGTLEKRFDCSMCHEKPSEYTDPGHIDSPPAEVTFSAFAAFGGRPLWDGERCEGVYCHGGSFDEGGARERAPRWYAERSFGCDRCHKFPPAGHAQGSCHHCHERITDESDAVVDPVLHIDGAIDLGDGSGGCTACHGAPPPPSVTADPRAVGAHAAHDRSTHRLSAPVPCSGCHIEPRSVTDRGHVDSELPAEVFSDEPPFDGLASSDGARPHWDRDTSTCSRVYCHGGGLLLARDATPGLRHSPSWTAGTREAVCGACHGLPPLDGLHSPVLPLAGCSACHGRTVDRFGVIIVTESEQGLESRHINGVVDVP